jgi:hypothetical protein
MPLSGIFWGAHGGIPVPGEGIEPPTNGLQNQHHPDSGQNIGFLFNT